MISASFRLYGDLNDFLPRRQKSIRFVHAFDENAAVKDTIEAIGVPHVEVDAIVVDQVSVRLCDRIDDAARVSVYPADVPPDVRSVVHLLPPPLSECRFVLDVHLGLLARRLRLLGFDTLYRNDYSDHEIVEISVADDRIALTRDIGLLKHAVLRRGRWVRSPRAVDQTTEVIAAFRLQEKARPFTRCTQCNGTVRDIDRATAAGSVPERVLRTHRRFYACDSCGRVYWGGSHYDRLRRIVDTLTGDGAQRQ
ncbi:MAG: twitching motility protein PilT [Chitinivibrionales bacterium]|nr:twitching motility protein PilT [Chitinivibrionales bacterium]